jgi:hypothetical protein
MKKNIYKIIPLLLVVFFMIPAAFADNGGGGSGGGDNGGGGSGGPSGSIIKLENPFRLCSSDGTNCDLFTFITTIINDIVLPLGGMLAVLAFIYSGFLYVTAQGNDTKIKQAHQALLYTAIGTAILLGAWAIANAVEATIRQLQ